MKLNPAEALDDSRTAWKALSVLGAAVVFFFLSHFLHFSPAFVALSSAGLALVLIKPDMKKMFARIEWSVLVFFTGLFVMVGGLEAAGIFDLLVDLVDGVSSIPPVLFGVILIWVVAGLSAIVGQHSHNHCHDPFIQGLGASGMDIAPLWWALAFGAGFGGNGTIIGSTANIIVTTLSEKTHTPITAVLWNSAAYR